MAFNRSNFRISELANADGLDDSIYSNSSGMTPEQIQQATQAATGIISAISNRPRNASKDELKSACGRKPLFNINGKKDKYQACVSDYLKQKAIASRPAPAAPVYVPPTIVYRDAPKPKAKKFLGMPIGLGIAVSVFAASAIGFAVYKLVLKK